MKSVFLFFLVFLASQLEISALLPWEPQDLEFRASQRHPWWEFPVSVTFKHKVEKSSSIKVEGFWDGADRWVVRAALPKAGQWTWRSESSDPAMHGLEGEMKVKEPTENQISLNPNLRGSLRISESGRFFEYHDGTPFLMLASTLWAGNTARCGLGENENGPFYQHLTDRKAKGFNTILMQYFHGYGDYTDSPGHRNEGGKTYLDIAAKTLNPSFFEYLDIRMQALLSQGFVIANPTTWWGKTKNCVFTIEDAMRISSYCAVRYGAFNAIWSLSGEYQYAFRDCGWTQEDFTALGEEVQQHNPFRRPLSIHPSGRTDWPPPHNVLSSLPFHGEAWLDHHWLQTGQGRDRLFHMVTKMAENRALTPTMPVFCSEAFYERPADPEGPYHTRWQVWTAYINGAAGFGYGAFGLWQFYDPNDPQGETGKFSGRESPWWEAQAFEGSAQLTHARKALEALEWWNLRPARDRIHLNGSPNPLPTNEDLSPPQAATIGNHTWILYIPRGNEKRLLSLDTRHSSSWTLQWINPRSGAKLSAGIIQSRKHLLAIPPRPSPMHEDWVVLIKRIHLN